MTIRSGWAAVVAVLLPLLAAPALAQPVTPPAPVVQTPAPAGPAEMITRFRQQHGQGKVTLDPVLTKIAHDQASAMASQSKLDHDVLGSFSRRMAPANAGTAAENIAYGYDSFPKTLDQWINSPSHRKNLLLRDASRIGVASVRGADKRTYWAMVIAGGYEPPPKPAKPAVAAKQAPAAKQAAAAKDTPPKPPAAVKKPKPKPDCTIKILSLCI
jgi:hypothetical protein